MKLLLQILCIAIFTAPMWSFIFTKDKTYEEKKKLIAISFSGPVLGGLGLYLLSKWH